MNWTWAAGARIGYLAPPDVLSYVNGGYTGTYFDQVNYFNTALARLPALRAASTDSLTMGWFLGGGVENALNSWLPGCS